MTSKPNPEFLRFIRSQGYTYSYKTKEFKLKKEKRNKYKTFTTHRILAEIEQAKNATLILLKIRKLNYLFI